MVAARIDRRERFLYGYEDFFDDTRDREPVLFAVIKSSHVRVNCVLVISFRLAVWVAGLVNYSRKMPTQAMLRKPLRLCLPVIYNKDRLLVKLS